MLKYSIRLTDDNIKQEEIVWGEKYLAPDLSFVSGVASQDYHLEKMTMIPSSNSISHTPNSVLPIETENVTREGFVVIEGKEYPIEKVNFNNIDYNYVFLNGKYYYSGDTGFNIDNWLTISASDIDEGTSIVVESAITVTSDSDDILKLDTIAWIENGTVTIDGETYIYDFDLKGLRRQGRDDLMDASAITFCDDIKCSAYTNTSAYTNVTKFVLTKNEEVSEGFENISFVKYFYYILYKDSYIYIYKNGNDEFVCDVPNSLLNVDEGVTVFSVYSDIYDENSDVATPTVVTGDTFDELRKNECYVTIEDGKYNVQGDIMNANDGSEIGIYLEGSTYNVDIGDVIRLVDINYDNNIYEVYNENDNLFVVFKNEYYKVTPSLCDKVEIEGNEYDIEYISGKTKNLDCVVHIDDDILLSMTINNDTTKLIQKGLVVSGNSAVNASYNINSYSGITVGDRNYQVLGSKGNGYYVKINETNEYQFIVTDIIGSSMLVCKPYLNNIYLSNDFIKELSRNFCDYVVSNQRMMNLYFKNNIFGKREITNTLGLEYDSGATSSDDYFNLFDNFTIYSPNAYIHIPLELSTPQGNNPLQDDLINEQFFKKEKEKAINPIIDMEKDIYIPKFMNSGTSYSGSDTDFYELEEIRFNLHFRTRDLKSWKVNEAENNELASESGLCNWFVTDFYPYKTMTDKESLLNSSDLVGLLYFTNDDIYYQKSKVGKSFLRLSFYDSVNQQTQMLLGTSTIFMNENRLFKKYIDNSRKGMYKNQFIMVDEAPSGTNILNKISVDTEFSGGSVTIDDDHRLGSEFIIKNKYKTDTSSEGYYLYIFREYSEKLVPKPIYMKIEFNHAGIGRTIPFIVPMRWSDADDDGYKTPVSALTLSNVGGDNSDLSILKNGIKLEDSYMQAYIPLYAVYDFKNKQYAYVFDERYVNIDRKEGKVTINLFEIKFAEDTKDDDDIKKKITYGKQPTAYIDINPTMFKDTDKKCD